MRSVYRDNAERIYVIDQSIIIVYFLFQKNKYAQNSVSLIVSLTLRFIGGNISMG